MPKDMRLELEELLQPFYDIGPARDAVAMAEVMRRLQAGHYSIHDLPPTYVKPSIRELAPNETIEGAIDNLFSRLPFQEREAPKDLEDPEQIDDYEQGRERT